MRIGRRKNREGLNRGQWKKGQKRKYNRLITASRLPLEKRITDRQKVKLISIC